MLKSDFKAFAELLDAAAGLLGKGGYDGVQKAMFFRALEQYPLEAVRAGLDAHMRDPKAGMYLPMPAHVIGRIEGLIADDGRPGGDEAWALALASDDEAETVVWTDEMAQAWASCRPIISRGDEVGARMAFKDTYARLVSTARKAGRAPVWQVSLGHDRERRDVALERAARLGLVKREDYPMLSAPDPLLMIANSGPMTDAKAEAVGKLLQLQEKLRNTASMHATFDVLERERTHVLQEQTKAEVQQYVSEHPDVAPPGSTATDLLLMLQQRVEPAHAPPDPVQQP